MINIKLLWNFIFIGFVMAQDKIPITMVTSNPFNAESRNPYPEFKCYLNSPDADARVTARRVQETRTNRANMPSNNPAPSSPQLISDSSYPAGSAVYRVSLSFNNNAQSYAFGTFSCEASKAGRKTTVVSNILMNSDVLSSPADGLVTKTVNEGETGVEIKMMLYPRLNVQTWFRNGGPVEGHRYEESGGTLTITDTVQKRLHEGVYEAVTDFTTQARMQPRHGLKRLIVRSCSANHWCPPDCAGICDTCYNGGVCDDETGRCICPPGFMGTNCLTACGGNRFGYSCEFQCSYDGDDEDSCSGLQFCLLDPFGCRCNTGWRDLGCNTACSAGTFGASCLQDCHCNGDCNRFTGLCNGTCEAGWTGDSCQIPDVCPSGYYGPNCTDKCYCKNGTSCDKTTGACQNRECTPGYTVYAGRSICQECRGDSFGESCSQVCRCDTDACNKVTGDCSGQCKPQWVDSYQCLAGVERVSSSKINPNTTSSVSCVTQIYSNSATILTVNVSRHTDQVVVNRGIEFVNSTRMGNTEVWRFTADDVREGDVLFCLVQDQGGVIVASLSTTVMEYDLLYLGTSPTLVSASTTSVTIRWRAWDPDRDDGDPPVMAYIPYYKEAASQEWIGGTVVLSGETLEYLADDLEADTEYNFSVAAVREGVNGEGPRSPSFNLRTKCDVSGVTPQNVQAYLNETTKEVNVSWQIPDDIMCSSGISSFFIYYKKEGSSQEPQLFTEVEGHVTWSTVNTQVLGVGEFSFFVTLAIDEESVLSQESEHVVITQQDNGGEPTFAAIFIAVGVAVLVLMIICTILFVVRYRRMKAVDTNDTDDKSVKGADYENAGVTNDPEGYSGLELQLNDRESKRYEEPDQKQSTKTGDSFYDPVTSQHTTTNGRNSASEYEEVPNTVAPGRSNGTRQVKSKSEKCGSVYEVPNSLHEGSGAYVNSYVR